MTKKFRLIFVLMGIIAAVVMAGCASNAAGPALEGGGPAVNDAAQAGPQAAGDSPVVAVQGSVDPPGCDGFSITAPDKYSVCGFAVLNANMVKDNVKISVRQAEADEVPAGAGKVLVQAIMIEWFMDGKMVSGPNDQYADIDLCYSAMPDKELVIKYYDEAQKAWVGLETTAANDQVCAKITMTGFYVLAEKE